MPAFPRNLAGSLIAGAAILALCPSKIEAQQQTPKVSQTCYNAPTAQTVSGTDERKLVVHDVTQLNADGGPDFSLRHTLQTIIDSAQSLVGKSQTPEDLLQTLLDTFGDSAQVNRVSKLPELVSVRSNESRLNVKTLLDPKANGGMVAVGLFNRLDLAPAEFSYCGEFRIV